MSRGPGVAMDRVLRRLDAMDAGRRPRFHDVIAVADADGADLSSTRNAVERLARRGQVQTRYRAAGPVARLQVKRVHPDQGQDGGTGHQPS